MLAASRGCPPPVILFSVFRVLFNLTDAMNDVQPVTRMMFASVCVGPIPKPCRKGHPLHKKADLPATRCVLQSPCFSHIIPPWFLLGLSALVSYLSLSSPIHQSQAELQGGIHSQMLTTFEEAEKKIDDLKETLSTWRRVAYGTISQFFCWRCIHLRCLKET